MGWTVIVSAIVVLGESVLVDTGFVLCELVYLMHVD